MSSARKYLIIEDDIFVMLRNSSFASRRFADASNPYAKDSGFKLHVSLSPADYSAHMAKIIKILVKYVSDDSIHHFKFINEIVLAGELKTAKKLSKAAWESLERLYYGDQFTIYIPFIHRKATMLAICREIETCIKQYNMRPGRVMSVSTPLTSHINFRLECLNGERVEPVLATAEQILIVNEIQRNSEIYQYLKNNLAQEYQKFYANDCGQQLFQKPYQPTVNNPGKSQKKYNDRSILL